MGFKDGASEERSESANIDLSVENNLALRCRIFVLDVFVCGRYPEPCLVQGLNPIKPNMLSRPFSILTVSPKAFSVKLDNL